MRSWKRLLALLLCLALLPCSALADGVQFSLSMTASEPEGSALKGGLADLLNIVTLEGTLATSPDDGCYDLNAAVTMDQDERTRTFLRLYGNGESLAWLDCSLLGDQTLMLNLLALQEFAIKMYHHMALPLQYLTIFDPFSAEDFLSRLSDELSLITYNDFIAFRSFSANAVADLFASLAGHMQSVTQLYYYIEALSADSGYDDTLLSLFDELPDWLLSRFADQQLTIYLDENSVETWTLGDTLLASVSANSGMIHLAELPEDCQLHCAWECSPDTSSVQFALELVQDEESLLHFVLSGDHLPQSLTDDASFAASLELTGRIVALHETKLQCTGEIKDGTLTVRCSADPLLDALTITGTLTPWTPDVTPHFTPDSVEGLNFFSLADSSLAAFVSSVKGPLIRGALPLAVHAPVSTCVSLMDILTQGGILDLIGSRPSASAASDDDDWEDEDEDWDEDWDDDDYDYDYSYDEEFDNYGYPYFDDEEAGEDDAAY